MKYLAIGALTLLAATSQAVAHHPFDTEFDANMPVTITGQVTTNPVTCTRTTWARPSTSRAWRCASATIAASR